MPGVGQSIREVDMGNFDGPGAASGLPNWLNYTRTYPTGAFNVYTRVAFGATAGGSTLSQVTNGWGTASQSPSRWGHSLGNSGGWQSYQWVRCGTARAIWCGSTWGGRTPSN